MLMASYGDETHIKRKKRYSPPKNIGTVELRDLIKDTGRTGVEDRQFNLLRDGNEKDGKDVFIYFAGNINLLNRHAVSIVGSRNVSQEGLKRAYRLAKELSAAGVTVMSGLAKGVDTAAHTGAIAANGKTAAIIGTPLNKAYPAENAELQTEIYTDHLLISPFAEGTTVFKGNFPKRNRVMALLSDATVIVEASDTSGTLHQASECHKLGRWLFIMKSVVNNPSLTWPKKFLNNNKTRILSDTDEILDALS
jgi:Predicted Rossmann fold nucleotide-binding protein involved in DNA uptake